MKKKIEKTKVLCLASSAAQFLVYFKYLSQLEDIEYKLIIIDNNDSKEHSNYMNNLRERGMFYMVKEKNNDFILKPKNLGEQRLRDRGRLFSKHVLDSGFSFNFEPDIIVFSQGGTVNYTIRELFPNKPKLIMYAEWFSITNMAARKEWPVVDDKQFIAQEWDIKSREDAQYCDAIVVPSKYAKSLWPKEYHHKVHEIFEGIDAAYLSHERIGALSKMDQVLRKAHPKKKIVAYAARTIESTRGFDLWVNAYKQLRELRDDLHFVVIGKNTPSLSAGGGARNHGIEDFKKWSLDQHGFKEEELGDITWFDPLPMYDFLAVLKSVDLLIYPTIGMFSNWGFFMSMYMKVPIIAANTSYFPEVIDQGSNGFLVDPYDTAKVVELSLKVLDDADLAREIGLRGHETICRDYSAKQANINFLGLIDSLIQSNHRKRFASVIDRFDEGDYEHDVTVKSEYGIFMVIDNLRVSDLAGVKELIGQVEHSGLDVLLNIAVKTSSPVFYDQLAELASAKVMIRQYLPMYSTGLLLNVLMQAMRSRFNVVIDPGVCVGSVTDFLAELTKSITHSTALYGRCVNAADPSGPAPHGEPVVAEVASDNAGCYLESDIVVLPTGLLDEAGYFHEKLDWEAALRDYVKRLSGLGIAVRGLNCSHITFEPLLSRLAKKHAAIGYKSHAYTAIYEKYFSEMAGEVRNILYIGERQYLQAIRMFLEYFPNANVQCFVNRSEKSFKRCAMHPVNQAQRNSISQALEAMGDIRFDLIIDNGGHTMRQTQTSLGVLFPRLVENGRYVIESMHVCPDTEGLLVKSSTQYVEGEETTTLELARMLRGDKELDFSNTFIQKKEAAYIRSHLAGCAIEMGKVSEMIVITRGGVVANRV